MAIRFLNTYLEENGDYEAVLLLYFYRAYRAWVRAKVTAFQVADHPERAWEARTQFELAGHFVAPHRCPHHHPRDGHRQEHRRRHVLARLGAIVARTDALRSRLAGVPLHERAALALGEVLYTPEMGRRTYVEVAQLADELLRAGWPMVVDGSFSRAAERAEARAVAGGHGLRFVFWCDAPTSFSWSRSAVGAKTGTRPPMGGRNCWPGPATDTSHRLTSRGRALPEIVPLAAPPRRGRCAGDGCVHLATENVDSAPGPGP